MSDGMNVINKRVFLDASDPENIRVLALEGNTGNALLDANKAVFTFVSLGKLQSLEQSGEGRLRIRQFLLSKIKPGEMLAYVDGVIHVKESVPILYATRILIP